METFHFPRPDLARAIAAQLAPDPFSGGLSGLYLAAPRRTGKTTFLRRDLAPAVLESSKFPIVVDLWEDRGRDPADILTRRIGQILEDLKTAPRKLLDRSRLTRISALGFGVGLAELKPFTGTISEGLERIADRVGQDVVLVVDEAQQALVSDAGRDAMFALKSARDAMNLRPAGPRLYLVMTGSHRGKLAELVVGSRSPFYGGHVQDFPVLGSDFVEALIGQINASRKSGVQFLIDDGVAAFQILMQRPEVFMQALRDEAFALDLSGVSTDRAADLTGRAMAIRARLWESLEADLDGLTPVQRGLFEALMEAEGDFSPYAAETLADVARRAGVPSISKGAAQTALKVLATREFVWQPGSGRYAVDNLDMLDMHRRKLAGS
jgi:hypothetical protein